MRGNRACSISLGPLLGACRLRRHVFHVELVVTSARHAASQFPDAAAEEAQERRRAGLVENDLEPVSVRNRAGFATCRADERVLESRGCGAVVRLRLKAPRRGLRQSLDLGFELTNRPPSFNCEASKLAASMRLRFGQ